jgi:chemotaxis signal transduction protein
MITLVDLRRRLGLTARPAGAAAQVIVASLDGEWQGLVVDSVVRVVTHHERVLRPATLTGVAA